VRSVTALDAAVTVLDAAVTVLDAAWRGWTPRGRPHLGAF
jgi:hypothetical protein